MIKNKKTFICPTVGNFSVLQQPDLKTKISVQGVKHSDSGLWGLLEHLVSMRTTAKSWFRKTERLWLNLWRRAFDSNENAQWHVGARCGDSPQSDLKQVHVLNSVAL